MEEVVIKKLLFIVIALGLFYCASSEPVNAQAVCLARWYCSWYSFSSGCVPTPPAGSNCHYAGPWAQDCDYVTIYCPPPCDCPKATAGHPIDLATGDTFIEETDVRIPGLAGGLTLSRTWNSIWPSVLAQSQIGLFGTNWRSTHEERIFVGGDGFVKYARADGNVWSFAYAGTAYASAAPANATATLNVDSNYTVWTLTFQNGEKRIFSYLSGSLTSIIDRNGNTTQLTYDSLNRLVTVADPGGRHLYFGYANNSSYLVTSVTSDVGVSLSYAYDSLGRLTQVTKPDLTTLSFAYDSNSNITSVTDSNGKILESHTYDSQGRGLTSSRANGVEAVTVSYH